MSDLENDQREWGVFTRLSRIHSAGGSLGAAGMAELSRLREAHPDWEASEDDRDDFAIWSESHTGDRGNSGDLTEVPTGELIPTMRRLVEADSWRNGGLWRRFVKAQPGRSFEALQASAAHGDWNADEWRHLFQHLRESEDRPLQTEVAEFLDDHPVNHLLPASHSVAAWFEDRYLRLVDYTGSSDLPMRLWDKFAAGFVSDDMELKPQDDPMVAVLNETPGMLAQVLIHELSRRKVGMGTELPDDLAQRFNLAIGWPGNAGLTAQCAFASQLPFLHYVASDWATRMTISLLNRPADQQTIARWRARFAIAKLGSVDLFNKSKQGFLATFGRLEGRQSGDVQVLLLLQAAFRKVQGDAVEITEHEAKSALVRGGADALSACSRILRKKEDGTAPEDHWTGTVKPLMQFAWPGDADLQTDKTTARLLDLILHAGKEFPDAVSTLRPFLTPAWGSESDWHFDTDFDDRGMALLKEYPAAGVELLDALVPTDRGPSRLNELLDAMSAQSPEIQTDPRFARLRGLARRLAS